MKKKGRIGPSFDDFLLHVMAGPVPAIHVLPRARKTWMPAFAGMTRKKGRVGKMAERT